MDGNNDCKYCNYYKNFKHVLFENETAACVADDKETPFELTERE